MADNQAVATWRIRQGLPRMKTQQNPRGDIKWGSVASDHEGVSAPLWAGLSLFCGRQVPDAGGRPKCQRREAMKKLLVKLVKDERGGEVLEYALIAGLIVVAAIAVIGTVGTKVLARWTSLNSSM
jgi:pilus assembly protein Flp/PilA